jgi:hypothetical protein
VEPDSRPAEPGHHRPQRDAYGRRNLAIREFLHFAQDQYFTVLWNQILQRTPHLFSFLFAEELGFQVAGARRSRDVSFIVEGIATGYSSVASEEIVGAIPYDRQQPGASIPTSKGRKAPISANVGFLHNIFRVVSVSRKPASQVVRGIQMAQQLDLCPFFYWLHWPAS